MLCWCVSYPISSLMCQSQVKNRLIEVSSAFVSHLTRSDIIIIITNAFNARSVVHKCELEVKLASRRLVKRF